MDPITFAAARELKSKPVAIEGDDLPLVDTVAIVPDRKIAERHVRALTDGVIRIRALYERHKDSNPAKWKAEKPNHPAEEWTGNITALWPKIEAAQKDGYAIYIVVNAGTCAGQFIHDKDITAVRALFIDVDDTPWPEQFHQEPDFFVKRDGTPAHAYWVEPTKDVSQFKPLQLRLAAHYGSDAAVCNPSRIMRLAGSLHLKGEKPALVTFEENPNRLRDVLGAYGIAGLSDGLPPLPAPEPITLQIANGKPVSPAIVEAMLRCILPSIGRNDGWLAVCGALTGAPIDDPAWDGLDVFIRWSRGDLHPDLKLTNYEGEDDCAVEWQRDLSKRAAGQEVPEFGALVKLAREHGYNERSDSVPALERFKEAIENAKAESIAAPSPSGAGLFPSYMGGEIGSITPPRWLIAPVIPTPGVGIIFGQYGTFKTTAATGIVDSILTATKAFGHFPPERGDAVLIAGEGLSGLKTRIEAQARNHGRDLKDYPLLVVAKVPRVDHPDEWAALVSTINARGLKPKIIFIDHLSIMLAGQDQNDATVATQAMQLAHELSMHFGCTVICLAHAGKDGERQVRGSSAFLDNVDFAYELTRSEGSPIVKVRCAKMRDGEAPEPFFLKAETRHGAAILTYATGDDARRASGKAVGLRPADVSAVLVAMGACPGGANEWNGETGGIPTKTLAMEIARARLAAGDEQREPSPQEIDSLVTILNRGAQQGGQFDAYAVRWKPRQWAIAPGSVSTGAGHV